MIGEILSIGDELLCGAQQDENASFIARHLSAGGIAVEYLTTVGDHIEDIATAVRTALARVDALVVTGGLGPTRDDLTRDGISIATGRELRFHEESFRRIEERFRRRNRAMPETNRLQAMIPEGAVVLNNDWGTAPGFLIDQGGLKIVVLPGVPSEMRPMFLERALPLLRDPSATRFILRRTIHAFGETESAAGEKIGELMRREGPIQVGITVKSGVITVPVTGRGEDEAALRREVDALVREIATRLGPVVFGYDGVTLEQAVAEALIRRKTTIALAESCTGGLVASMLTRVPGISASFLFGAVTYSNAAKQSILGVPEELLKSHGAVSEEVAGAMCRGIADRVDADIGVGITGIAGPGGGTPRKTPRPRLYRHLQPFANPRGS